MSRSRRSRLCARLALAGLATASIVFATSSAAFGAGGFTPGDLVIYETLGTSSAAQAVSLVDYSTAGVPSGYSVALPTTFSGSNKPLVESGAALNDGELTLSADGQSLIATGYDAAVGTASITSATSTPRTVALVSPTGVVDTSTALSDTTTEGNNFRSATTAVTGGTIYTGGGGGTGVTTDGATSTSYLTGDKVHEVQVVGGQLYESTTKGIYSVGSGLPTSGTQTTTALVSSTNGPANLGPDQFALVTLGSGTTPDTLYVADGSNGATAGEPNAVEKYSLVSGAWVETGSIMVPLAVGLVASVVDGVASIYVTGATSSSAANNTVLYGITDSSGFDGTLSGSATTLATAPSGDDFKGLAFAPVTPGAATPEASIAVALPVLGLVLLGGAYVVYRRRTGAQASMSGAATA
ncbi:MAG: hypothetical protein ACLQRH_18580 [Acidimicrobiales bacterium]